MNSELSCSNHFLKVPPAFMKTLTHESLWHISDSKHGTLRGEGKIDIVIYKRFLKIVSFL
jgi:hypothetical protein